MQSCIEILLLEYIYSSIFTREFMLCAHGRAGQTQHLFFWRRISQSEIRNSAAAEKSESESEGGQKFLVDVHSPTPFLFARPSVRFRSCRAKRGNQSGFCSKKVRTSFSNCDQTKKRQRAFFVWSGCWELNPVFILPKDTYYRYTTPRNFIFNILFLFGQ